MDSALAAVTGALIGASAGVATQLMSARAAWAREHGERLGDRLTDYLASTYQAVLTMGEVARAPQDLKADLQRTSLWPVRESSTTDSQQSAFTTATP